MAGEAEQPGARAGYLVACGPSITGPYPGLHEALQAAAEKCRTRAVIIRGVVVAVLDREDLAGLRAVGQRAGVAGEAAGAGAARPGQEAAEEAAAAAAAAVVLDQMFKTFAEILDRELRGEPLVFHEVLGRGIDRPVKVSERVYQQPARDDYDVLKLLEELSSKHSLVIFFTGDKRLASQARSIPGVRVVYLPPGEAPGKEQAIKLMVKAIREALASSSRRG
ncbi:MAG: hypothetical protein GXO15_06940 [Crenarchaeota archaeon]|nr:hypothetical protein [Thermoproteota archaeon]